jgi:hypothetical protein
MVYSESNMSGHDLGTWIQIIQTVEEVTRAVIVIERIEVINRYLTITLVGASGRQGYSKAEKPLL